MSKRPLTDEIHASRAQESILAHPSTPTDLALQLRGLGSRVRKSVMEGYSSQSINRHASAPPSPTKGPPQSGPAMIFASANDILRDVYAAAPPQPPISPRKRARRDDDSESEDSNMAVDDESEISVDLQSKRPVKPKPKRPLMQTQSLPSNMFGSPRAPHAGQIAAVALEDDWSVNSSKASPHFEPLML